MKAILFVKYSKFYVALEKCQQNSQKILMVLKIIPFEVKPLISLNYDKNACEQPLTC